MAILVDKKTRVLVQGITGREGSFHAKRMLEYGTNVIAGVTPGKGGLLFENKIPVFNSVADALRNEPIDASVIFVLPYAAVGAIREAGYAGIPLIVAITEGIPVLDMLKVKKRLFGTRTRLIGPNCPGIIAPDECKIGIMPDAIHKKGSVGVISRSGTLMYEAVKQLTDCGIGQSTCVGVGGDPVSGTSFVELLEMFERDPETQAVVLIGEIGGNAEEKAAAFIAGNMSKPVIGYVCGISAPPEKRMGHAGALISKQTETAAEKIKALQNADVVIAENLAKIGETTKRILG